MPKGNAAMSTFTRREFVKQSAALTGVIGCGAGLSGVCAEERPEIDPEALKRLREELKGRLVLSGDSVYESARRVLYWNPKTERKPIVVVQCGHEEDVVRAVEFARKHSLEVAVRSGGHSHLAWGSSNGLVIDLSALKRMTID